MEQIIRIGIDTSKHLFQLHGVNAAEQPVLRRKFRRKEMIEFFEKLPATMIAIEACGGSHHWARLLTSFGHEVKLIAPQLAKPYVKRGKNDAADAEALCEAMSRPTKTGEQQASLMLVGMRDRLVRNKTQAGRRPAFFVGLLGDGWPALLDGGQAQIVEDELQARDVDGRVHAATSSGRWSSRAS